MVVSDCLSSTQQYGMTCSFNCARGYHVSGPSSVRCGIGGVWSDDVQKIGCDGLYFVFASLLFPFLF